MAEIKTVKVVFPEGIDPKQVADVALAWKKAEMDKPVIYDEAQRHILVTGAESDGYSLKDYTVTSVQEACDKTGVVSSFDCAYV